MPFAARVTDPTTHGSPLIPGPGSTDVLIGSLLAWRTVVDQHACPAVNSSGADGVGSVLIGSPTVYIDNEMACRVGDVVVEKPGAVLGPANPIAVGCPTVVIGGPTAAVTASAGNMTVVDGGVSISGQTDDVVGFLQMMGSVGTLAGRTSLAQAINDAGHPITLNIGRNDSHTVIDSFGTNAVDVGDLSQVPAVPPAGHPNATTRDEMIVHFMVERNNAAVTGSPNFGPAHQSGIDAQNAMRAERGQPAVTSQVFAGHDAAGNTIGRTNYADGTHQDAIIDGNNNIVRVDPP
jgi:PAAR motif